ncbi:MAG: TonB-dependent receptor [Thermodesulfovibrionales bacterium]|nr:TonB-dependent receptor [Thermodesulfovibrionales bacterium]
MKKGFWVFLMIFMFFPSLVFGSDQASKPYKFEELVVTETKIPQTETNITQKVDIVTEEEMDKIILYNKNIADIFKYTPGTFVNVLSRNDANWGSYGGLGPKYNVYLLDGLPIDSFVDTMSLDILALSHAEVHRGPASVMYSNYLSMDFAGAQSPLAGITNLILKEKITSPMTRFQLGYGKYNTLNGKLYHQGSSGNFHYFMGASYEQSDYTNYGTNPSWLNMLDDPDYKKIKLYFKTTYFIEPDKQKISLFAHHTNHVGDVGRPNRDYKHNYDTINIAYSNQLTSDLHAQLKLGYRHYDRKWEEDNFPNLSLRSEDGVKQHIIPVDLTFNYKHMGNSLLTFGIDYQYASYKTTSESANTGIKLTGNDAKARSFGIFVQEKLVIDKFVFRLGSRFNTIKNEYNLLSGIEPAIKDKSWDRFLWSAGARYNATDSLSFFSNIGTSFIAPSAKSVGGTLNLSDKGVPGRHGQLPNPNLKPEKGISYDLGMDYFIMPNMEFGLRLFVNEVDDAIVENRVSLDPSQSQSVNAGKAKSKGFEVQLIHAFNKNLSCFANYTFIDTKVSNRVDPVNDNSDIPFVPQYILNLGLTFNLPYDITISPYLNAVGKYYDTTSKQDRKKFGPYETINIKAQKMLFKTQNYKANLNLELSNITDRKYEMPWQFKDTGFNAFAAIELIF